MQSLRDIAPYLALGAAVLDVVLLILVVRLIAGQRRLRRAQLAVLGDARRARPGGPRPGPRGPGAQPARRRRGARRPLTAYKADLDKAFTHRAVVRYDAFRDIGGEQSASIALLDNQASGLVISMIHSRDYARIYVKELRRSVPDRALSPEEVEVVEKALAMDGQAGRRRRQSRGRPAKAAVGASPTATPPGRAGTAGPSAGAAPDRGRRPTDRSGDRPRPPGERGGEPRRPREPA